MEDVRSIPGYYGPMRTLLVGLDGFDHAVFRTLAASGRLPRLSGIEGLGAAGVLASPPPSSTIPSWTTILTGVNPGRHGMCDFTRREGYGVRLATTSDREVPNVFEILSTLGRRVVAVGFPGTFPPVEVDGVVLAGWDSPAAVRGRREGCWPGALHDDLVKRFGLDYLPFDVIDQYRAGVDAGPGWYREACSRLVETAGRRTELAMYLADERAGGPVDLLAVHFPEPDTAGHHFWHLHDLNSPRSPAWLDGFVDGRSGRVADPLAEIYESVDRAVGELVDRFHPAAIVVASDHGMGGSGLRVASINRRLASEGFLRADPVGPSSAAGELIAGFGRLGADLVPPDMRADLLSAAGPGLAGGMLSRVRFGGIDWKHTMAFSEDLNYSPSVWINQIGREPAGTVLASERTWWLKLVSDTLERWTAPDRGVEAHGEERKVVERIHLREDLVRGPVAARMPDLLVELTLDSGYAKNLHPGTFRRMGSAVEDLPGWLLRGSKGRSMPGSHRPGGVWILAGLAGSGEGGEARVEASRAGPLDQPSIAPLILELAGCRVPGHFDAEPGRVTDGRIDWFDPGVLAEAFLAARDRAAGDGRNPPGRDDPGGVAAVEKRLEDLGYT